VCAYDAFTSGARHIDTSEEHRDRRPRSGSHKALRLGVTGHRSLDHEADIRRSVNTAIDQVLAVSSTGRASGKPPDLVVVSALAEGADRLVVQECLSRDGATLVAALPLPAEEYAKDFVSDASRLEFAELLATATSVEIAQAMPTRDEAYERAGQMMVEQSDSVIAIWDGFAGAGRGGTADIVAYARSRGVPIIRIDSRTGEKRADPEN
jgi:hypothetical protein